VRKIALLDDYQHAAMGMADWASLPADVQVVTFSDHLDDETKLADRLADFEIVMLMRERTPFLASLFPLLPNLKLLVTAGMRNASVDLDAATKAGVVVCGTGGQPHATAELTWGLILALMRKIPHEDRATREGHWQLGVGLGLAPRTLGVIGLGRLGAQVAKVGLAFNMKVLAWSQNLTQERADEVGVTLVSKDELLAQSDVISIHLVLSERTRHLLGASELAAMKPSAYLVNTSRGPIVDEDALVDALRADTIAGAGLDVFEVEPLPLEHPFRQLENTVITPHIGYVTTETYETFYGEALEDIQAWLKGAPIRIINP
jgi:phosphoglycerate dehydrogenase-like enzyme